VRLMRTAAVRSGAMRISASASLLSSVSRFR